MSVNNLENNLESKIKSIEKDIADKKAGPDAQKELDNLKAGKEINGQYPLYKSLFLIRETNGS